MHESVNFLACAFLTFVIYLVKFSTFSTFSISYEIIIESLFPPFFCTSLVLSSKKEFLQLLKLINNSSLFSRTRLKIFSSFQNSSPFSWQHWQILLNFVVLLRLAGQHWQILNNMEILLRYGEWDWIIFSKLFSAYKTRLKIFSSFRIYSLFIWQIDKFYITSIFFFI